MRPRVHCEAGRRGVVNSKDWGWTAKGSVYRDH